MNKRPLLTAMGLVGVGIVFGVVLMSTWGTNAIESLFAAGITDLGAKQAPAPASAAVKALNDQFVSVSNAVTNSVVSISVKAEMKSSRSMPSPREFFRFFGPDGMEEDMMPDGREEAEGAGSGVIVTADGYIVTNNHVVENAKEGGITVTTSEQQEYKAKLVGRDPLTDLAVLKIEATLRLGVSAASLVHLGRVLASFEAYCTVTQTVGASVPITVRVVDRDGVVVK
jgi:serine protease Do